MSRGTMKLVDKNTGEMECKICGFRHWAMVKPDSDGRFWRGAWQCPYCNTGLR